MPFATVDELIHSISALPSAAHESWLSEVNQFIIASDAKELNHLQRDGATAVIDLAGEYQVGRGAEDRELTARVIGRMSDIQVRDFALGSHSLESADSYWRMWRDLLVIAPTGFIAPIASVFAALAYERGEGALAQKALSKGGTSSVGNLQAATRGTNRSFSRTKTGAMKSQISKRETKK
jgi:hypothetical protein